MKLIPKRLKREPLIEAIWQVQFEAANAGELLPGLLYAQLHKRYPEVEVHRLPTADIPAAITQSDPTLRFGARIRLAPRQAASLWQVGDRVVTLNCQPPHTEWESFKEAILDLIEVIEECRLIPQPQRHSLRYIDLLTEDDLPDLSALQFTMQLGTQQVRNLPLQTRLELSENGWQHVIQIATPAHVQLPDGGKVGTIIDLETFPGEPLESWEQARSHLDTLHLRSRQLLFDQVLTAQAIEQLEPEY
jgi:uncharacterized protein (TIGR04255 family)